MEPPLVLVHDDGFLTDCAQLVHKVLSPHTGALSGVDVDREVVVLVEAEDVFLERPGGYPFLDVEAGRHLVPLGDWFFVPKDLDVLVDHVEVLQEGGVLDESDQSLGIDAVVALLDVQREVVHGGLALFDPSLHKLVVLLEDLLIVEYGKAQLGAEDAFQATKDGLGVEEDLIEVEAGLARHGLPRVEGNDGSEGAFLRQDSKLPAGEVKLISIELAVL